MDAMNGWLMEGECVYELIPEECPRGTVSRSLQ